MSKRIVVRRNNFEETVKMILPYFETKSAMLCFFYEILPYWDATCSVEAHEKPYPTLRLYSFWGATPHLEVCQKPKELAKILKERFLLTYENLDILVQDKKMYRFLYAYEPVTWKNYLPILRKTLKNIKVL